MYLLYFPPERPGQLPFLMMISRKFLTTQCQILGGKMVKQGYNYLNGPIHYMAEIFETRIKKLEKSIPPSVPSRNNRKSKKGSKKRKSVILDDSNDEDSDQGHSGKKFCHYHDTYGHTTDQCTTLKALVKQVKQKKSKHFHKKKRVTKHEVNVMVQKQIKTQKERNYVHSRK